MSKFILFSHSLLHFNEKKEFEIIYAYFMQILFKIKMFLMLIKFCLRSCLISKKKIFL